MAQPFLDEDLTHLYQISPHLTNWLNDKQNMVSYIPDDLLPVRYATYKNGTDFFNSADAYDYPCVVKVSSSSAGDGVFICGDINTQQMVKKAIQNTKGTVLVEQFIETLHNYGIQFGIPYETSLPIEIIGINRQLTTKNGEFIGGIIYPGRSYDELNNVKNALISKILPHIRQMGWYGVGCFDVLSTKNGKAYIIDCNFRMTGMTAYLMLVANRQITKPLVSFSGEFLGELSQFKAILADIQTRENNIHILTVSFNDNICRCNAAILFDTEEVLQDTAKKLLNAGIKSQALEYFA